MREYSFERLDVWKLSSEFSQKVYQMTAGYPKDEKYGLTNQLRRAAISIPNNLAEGSGRISFKEKAHFTQISYGSLMECLNLIIISKRLKFISEQIYKELREMIDIISIKLSSLRKYQLNSLTPNP